jgi:hypothetical protein
MHEFRWHCEGCMRCAVVSMAGGRQRQPCCHGQLIGAYYDCKDLYKDGSKISGVIDSMVSRFGLPRCLDPMSLSHYRNHSNSTNWQALQDKQGAHTGINSAGMPSNQTATRRAQPTTTFEGPIKDQLHNSH